MTHDVHVKLNPGLPWQQQLQPVEDSLHQQNRLTFKEETNEVLHLERNYVALKLEQLGNYI
jgi:hypothetical protein